VTRQVAFAVASACAVLAAACSSSGPSPRPQRIVNYAPIVAECALRRGLIPPGLLHPRTVNGAVSFADVSSWYRGGRVLDNPHFAEWWNTDHASVQVAGRALEYWADAAGSQQTVPAQVCGSTAMPTPAPSPLRVAS
jgi:hypothetical protein